MSRDRSLSRSRSQDDPLLQNATSNLSFNRNASAELASMDLNPKVKSSKESGGSLRQKGSSKFVNLPSTSATIRRIFTGDKKSKSKSKFDEISEPIEVTHSSSIPNAASGSNLMSLFTRESNSSTMTSSSSSTSLGNNSFSSYNNSPSSPPQASTSTRLLVDSMSLDSVQLNSSTPVYTSPSLINSSSSPSSSQAIKNANLVALMNISPILNNLMSEKHDKWISSERTRRKWNDYDFEMLSNEGDAPRSSSLSVDPFQIQTPMLDKACRKEGFHFELGRPNSVFPTPFPPEVEDMESNTTFYKTFFFGKDHMNLIGEDEIVGPVCISYETGPESGDKRAILRTKKDTKRFFIPSNAVSSFRSASKFIKTEFSELDSIKFLEVNHPDLQQRLVDIEQQLMVDRYKFGVLYMTEGQTDENDIFSNNILSRDFEEFLDFLGERVTLDGWSNFRGGLDCKKGSTGTHSVYTNFRDFEIMFHVAPLLPFQENDLQRVERKRHIGNDVVVIVFKEASQPFNPLWLKSQFNHIFVVVEVDKSVFPNFRRSSDSDVEKPRSPRSPRSNETFYRVSIGHKPGVNPYPPFLPNPAILPRNEAFREFFLTKLINSERAAMHAPDFKGKMMRTSKELLGDIIKTYKDKKPEQRKVPIRKDKSKTYLRDQFNPVNSSYSDELPKIPRDFDANLSPRGLLSRAGEFSTAEDDARDLADLQREIYMESLDCETMENERKKLNNERWILVESERERLEHIFNVEDSDQDGLLTSSQALKLLSDPTISTKQMYQIYLLADADRDLHLDLQEFLVAKGLVQGLLKGNILPPRVSESVVKSIACTPTDHEWSLSAHQKYEYLKAFYKTDSDQDGKITGTEAAYLFLASGLANEELEAVWKLSDINRDRCLDVEEYVIAQLLVKAKIEGTLKKFPSQLPNKLRRISTNIKREVAKKKEILSHGSLLINKDIEGKRKERSYSTPPSLSKETSMTRKTSPRTISLSRFNQSKESSKSSLSPRSKPTATLTTQMKAIAGKEQQILETLKQEYSKRPSDSDYQIFQDKRIFVILENFFSERSESDWKVSETQRHGTVRSLLEEDPKIVVMD